MKEAKWNVEFDVGVEEIDSAHREMVTALKKVVSLLDGKDPEQCRLDCRAALTELEMTMRQHFAQEEAYMRSIGYDGYERHLKQHDYIRDKIMPDIAKDLAANRCDKDSVLRALGRGIGWMTGHVPEDLAITNRGFRRTIPAMSDYVTKLELVLTDVVRGVFHTKAELLDEHYRGQSIGDAYYHELHYLSESEDRRVSFMVITEKEMMEAATGTLLSRNLHGMDQLVLSAVKELTHIIFLAVRTYFREEISRFRLVYEGMLTAEEAESRFHNETPFYGLLFKTRFGRFAICFDIYG